MSEIQKAAAAIAHADALLFTAGAGMGVDSGLPDFRGNEGFWKAYPPLRELGLSFTQIAIPRWFREDSELAWGFYAHRLRLYRETAPHAGFQILLQWAANKSSGAFVFTSNVDGHFQRAGFSAERVLECHGSIHYLQCAEPCCEEIWSADGIEIDFDESTFRAEPPLPQCARCGGIARPNILQFYDGQWLWKRTKSQQRLFDYWINQLGNQELIIIECGAGSAIPTVRATGEELQKHGATLIRINPTEAQGPLGTISLDSGALSALRALEAVLPAAPPES